MMRTDPRQYRTCADPEPRYLSIRNVDGIGQGRSEGTQSRPAYNAYLRLFEVLWDALGEDVETSSEGQLGVSHRINIGRLMDLGCRERNRFTVIRPIFLAEHTRAFLFSPPLLSFFQLPTRSLWNEIGCKMLSRSAHYLVRPAYLTQRGFATTMVRHRQFCSSSRSRIPPP